MSRHKEASEDNRLPSGTIVLAVLALILAAGIGLIVSGLL